VPLRDAVNDRQRYLMSRVSVAEKATAADQAWSASWAKACSDCWLGAGGPAPSLETVREILAVVADLGPALETQAGLADRIAKMEKDQADFAAEVTAIASALNLPSRCVGHAERKSLLQTGLKLCVAKTKSGRIGDEVRRGLRVI
jgi:uncharacterized protein YhaN